MAGRAETPGNATRVALVTGGMRGIGVAIARRRQRDGYGVVVTYLGNDAAAGAFRKDTDIANYKWDVTGALANLQRIPRNADVSLTTRRRGSANNYTVKR